MKLLYISEIVGKCGIWSVKICLPHLKLQYKPDYIIANANSATAAGGLSRQHAGYLRKLGVHCITLGDNAFINPHIFENKQLSYCVRPLNISSRALGLGYKAFYSQLDKSENNLHNKEKELPELLVFSLLGQYGRHRVLANDAFDALDYIAQKFSGSAIFLDYSSFSTGEKQSMKFYADGRVSAIIGSGMKVRTADEQISERGTAYISDAGRTAAFMSVAGYEAKNKIREYKTGLTEYSSISWDEPQFQGVFLELDGNNKAIKIERVLVKDYGNNGENS